MTTPVPTARKARVTAALAVALAVLATGCADGDDTIEPLGQATDTETTSEAGGEATGTPSDTETPTGDATTDQTTDEGFTYAGASDLVRGNLSRSNWLPIDMVNRDIHPYTEWANNPSTDHEALWDQLLELTIYSPAAEPIRQQLLTHAMRAWPDDHPDTDRQYSAHGFFRWTAEQTGPSRFDHGHVIGLYATGLIEPDDGQVREETWLFPVMTNDDITEIVAAHPPVRTITADGVVAGTEAMPPLEDFVAVDEYDPAQATPVPPPSEPTETRTE